MADEQTNLEQMEAAVKRYEAASGGKVGENYCLYADLKSEPPRYQVFLEEPDVRRRMQMHCMIGACVRKIWDIRVQGGMAKPVRRMLHSFHGKLAKYERYLEESGRQMAQIKLCA